MTAHLLSLSTPAALLEVIAEYDSLGVHRTGTTGDDATTTWMIDRLAGVGVEGQPHVFRFPQLVADQATLRFGDTVITGHAQMDAGLTPPAGRTGPLKSADRLRTGDIAVLDLAGEGGGGQLGDGLERAVAAGVAGIVVLARRGAGSFFLTNAPHLTWPTPVPVLLVPAVNADTVLRAAGAGVEATLTVSGVRLLGSASNVVARVPADAPVAGPPVAVMTPKSGWFTCAAERGGGLAIWLACAERVAATAGRSRDVLFLFTAGHELGHAGLESYLLEHPTLAAEVDPWIHLGASIGAAVRPALTLFASDEGLRSQGQAALTRADAGPFRVAAAGMVSGGEARNIHARGGRFLSLAGGHAYFHHPEDRPDKVDAGSVARYAAAISELVIDECTRR